MRCAAVIVGLLAAGPAAAQAPPAAAAPVPPAGPTPEAWQPRGGFELQALDKITARTQALSGRVGQTVQYGSLSITVRACLVRPPDQPADAATFLEIADSHVNMPNFSGWMLLSEPSVSMLEHPVYDIRPTACRP